MTYKYKEKWDKEFEEWYNNRYGHPHKEVIDLLEELKIRYLGTY